MQSIGRVGQISALISFLSLITSRALAIPNKPSDALNALDVVTPVPTMTAPSIIERALQAGPVVFSVLLTLLFMSIVTWAVLIAKYIYLRRVEDKSLSFIQSFWNSRSLNELNGRLNTFPKSPMKEAFKTGYAELHRNSHLKDSSHPELKVGAAMDNLKRSLHKAKVIEKRQLERFLSFLAISASACPFIGLFGTVWGIMSAFEGIAQTGSTSLSTVAPGISEALIATAFGLAAAIPAVIGYNLSSNKIRGLMVQMDSFQVDFLNIVERYFVSDKPSSVDGKNVKSAPKV